VARPAKNKQPEAAVVQDDPSKPSRAAALISKTFGEGVIVSGRDVYDKKREVISISPAIDAALGGGLVTGTLATLAGDAGCGKTSTALQAGAAWQAMGRRLFYIAAEARIYRMNLAGIKGLDPDRMEIVHSTKGQILTAEKYLEIAEKIIKTEEHAMIIIDSFSILSDSSEMEMGDYDKSPPVGGSPRLVGRFCRKMAPIIPINDNVVIGIAHWYTNIGGKKKWAVSLPKKVEYARSTGMVCEWVEYLTKGDETRAWGQKIHWKVERTPLGPPGTKFTSILRYDHGIDKEFELLEQAKELGLVNGSTWLSFDFLGDDPPKANGMDKACTFLVENPDVCRKLHAEVRRMSFDEEPGDEGA